MSPVTGLEQARRTRLTPTREAELFGMILDLLVEEGYDNVSMDTIAARTHSSKATLYRQWQSKPRLIAATLRHAKKLDQIDLFTIDTGSLGGDLREIARRVGSGGQEQTGLFWSLADTIRRNPELKIALQESLIEPAERELDAILRRAIKRGEIEANVPSFDFVHCTMMGAALSHSITNEGEADADYMVRYVDAVILPALGLKTPAPDADAGAESETVATN